MAVNGQAELITALQARDFSQITGTAEAEWVDFKMTAYQHDPGHAMRLSTRGKWELCKDIAAFANKNGGCLVIGYGETTNPSLGVKVAGAVRPVRISAVDVDHYKDVIERGVYPAVIGVETIWYAADDSDNPKGVLLINVPSSSEKQHVLRRVVNNDDEEIEAIAIPVRNSNRTVWYSAERVYHLIRQAEQQRLPEGVSQLVSSNEQWERADHSRDRLVELQNWTDAPLYVLQAVPFGGPARLEDFYGNIKQKFENPTPIRPMGFNLGGIGGQADVISRALVRRASDSAGSIEPNGLFSLMVTASPSFLGWALNRGATDMLRINSTALIELTLEFCRFVANVLEPAGTFTQWDFRVECRNFMSNHITLASGPASGFARVGSWQVATSDILSERVNQQATPEVTAYHILGHVYGLFGLPESGIPHTTDSMVDPEQIIHLRI